MILRGRQRAEHAICQRCSCWLPALLNWIEFRRVRRKILYAQRFLMSMTELINLFTMVCRSVVDEEQDATPSSQRELDKSEKVSLPFSFRERVREPSSGSCTKNVGADVLVIHENDGVASSSRPAARDDGN
jgi:hypothetical protein